MPNILLLMFALSLCLFATAACGDADGNAPQATATIPETSQAETPEDVGNAIKTVYVHALNQTVALLEDQPPAEEVVADLRALREATIEQMVALGRKREDMDPSQRAIVDRPMNLIRTDAAFMETFQAFSKTETNYRVQPDAPGYEVYQMIRGMNIITQYAFFELLREQEPAEAQRLGV